MPVRNASEFFRLQEEYEDLKHQLKNSYWTKAQKVATLNQLREYERILGIKGENYNSSEF